MSLQFPEISRFVLFKITFTKLQFKKLCCRWVSKLWSEQHRKERTGSALKFLTLYNKENLIFWVISSQKMRHECPTWLLSQNIIQWSSDTHHCLSQWKQNKHFRSSTSCNCILGTQVFCKPTILHKEEITLLLKNPQ